jgi:hypothetical protein
MADIGFVMNKESACILTKGAWLAALVGLS